MVTLVNRAKMTIVSTGTGPLTLGSAVNGYQSLVAAGVGTGDVVRYIIEDGDAWEIGLGTYSANTSSLSRSVSESSNAGAPIALSGKAIVFLGLSAADINARVEITDPRLSDAREWAAGTISQAEAEAGTATTRRAFTAQRIRQAILGWWNGSSDKAKLDGIAAGAQVNVPTNLGITGTGNSRTITSSTGTDVTVPVATTATAGLMATGDKSKLDGIAAGAQVNTVTSVAGKTGAITLAKADVGLASVDNTSDVDKPISTAMQTALSGKVDTTDSRLTDSREWSAGTIAQAEAEAGTATTRRAFTAQRVRQAILGWWNGSSDKAKLDGIAAGAQVNVATNLGYTSAASAGTLTSSTGTHATLPAATTAVAGLLTSADKTKLDGIAAGAQVNVATNLGYSAAAASGAVTSSTGSNATLPAATTSLAGLLTSTDKTKLDGVAAGAQVNVATNLGITGTGNSRTITSSTGTNVTIPIATSSTAGLMATGDKSKLDGIAAGAQVNEVTNLGYSAAAASGMVTSSTGSNATLPAATTSLAGLLTSADKAKLEGIAAGAQVNVATDLGVAGGTTAGPTITSSTGSNVTLPTASTTTSGVVTTGAQSWAGAKTFTGVVTAPDFVTTSDARLKREIAPIFDALAKLQCLQGVTFEMADDPRRRMGLLAQEVQAVAPEAVIETEGVLRLAYGNLLGLLVEAIKDLSLQVDQLKGTKP